MNLSSLIAYYRDCYLADTRTLNLNNYFNSKVENKLVLTGKDELLNGNLPYVPISEAYANEVEKNLSVYKKEKVFYCAAFFIIGKREEAHRKDNKICAPLFLYPAKIVRHEGFQYAEVAFGKRIINVNFLNSIKKEEVQDLYEALIEQVDARVNGMGTVGRIKRILEDRLHDFKADELLFYPDLYSADKIKKRLQPKNLNDTDGFSLIPSVAFCVLKRSTSTQGINADLTEISKTQELSEPLQFLLSEDSVRNKTSKLPKGSVPAILSSSQQQIIDSVNQNKCTLVIGPPGTGKSFSIATLAIDFLSKGKSVLIASKTDQAVDVIYNKIEKDLDIKGVALRAGKSNYKKSLKGQLSTMLTITRKRPTVVSDEQNEHKFNIRSLSLEIEEVYRSFKKMVRNELRWGTYVAKYLDQPTFFARLKLRYIKWRNSLQTPHWELTKSFVDNLISIVDSTRKFIELSFQNRVHHALYNRRKMFRSFLNSLSARHSSRQELLFKEIELNYLLETFPVWLVNMSDIHDVFPLDKEIFDLAIIDEATQCDIASCIPIIQRAKRVVVVGDPKQLRHVSFLSGTRQYSLQKKHKIMDVFSETAMDYRNTSILDLMDSKLESQAQVCFLDEHFRSKPDLIRFSNKHFYHDELRIMTDSPLKDVNKHRRIVEVNGLRDKNGVNKKEGDALITMVKGIIKDQENLTEELCQSIGVLSPFRDQVDYLGDQISKKIELHHINKHNISCGTAYSFQGEERDIMLISLCLDKDAHHSAVIHMNKPDVFNVSITRARTLQYLFKSFPDQFDSGIYLSEYLSDIRVESQNKETKVDELKDQFAIQVTQAIKERKLTTWTGHSVAGLLVDIILKNNGKFYGINLIGYPGMFFNALHSEDYKILARAGLPTFPMPYTFWRFEKERCLTDLMKFIEA